MKSIAPVILALCFASTASAFTPLVIAPKGKEKCYGIADAGQNDGPFMTDYPEASQGAGGSKYPCERTAWRWVRKGKCTTIMIGFTENGTALTGTLTPRPEGVNPVKCMPYMVFKDEDEDSGEKSEQENMGAEPAGS